MMRALDIGGALLGGLVALPIFAVAALAVRLDLGRPVLFVQARSGRGGQVFRMAKLRTMTEARNLDGALKSDGQRVTRLGRFLRRSRIDELPGLWHVLAGDMSLVGPRPLLPQTVAAMGDEGHARGTVRPGLTGWAQVSGNALLSDDAKLALDLWYIEHASTWLDLTIVFRTLGVIGWGERIDENRLRGAYAGRHRRGG